MLLAGACLVLAAPATAYVVKWTPVQENDPLWVTGSLTWASNTGKIAWQPGTSVDDDMPSLPDQATQEKRQQDYKLEAAMDSSSFVNRATSGLKLTAPILDDVFESAPLEDRLYLNATRGFQVTLFLRVNPANPSRPCEGVLEELQPVYKQSATEPNLELELRANGVIIGGANGDDGVWWDLAEDETEPEAPDNYGVCRFQMHSERHVLEPGTVLKLTIRHAKQEFYYSYGFKGTHQSMIQIGLLPTEELFYRFPELFPDDEDANAAPTTAAIGLGALFLLPRRRGPKVALMLLLVAGLAGCLGGGSDAPPAPRDASPSGSVENTFVKDVNGTITAPDLGAILGRVRDDMGLPIPDVHVALLGTSNFTETDGKGKFQFRALEPGAYKIRFTHKEYRTYEVEQLAKGGFVARPDFTLFLINPKVRDERPHLHDYWDGKTTIDGGSFSAACPPYKLEFYIQLAAAMLYSNGRPDDGHCWQAEGTLQTHADGTANLVNPGTTDVEVTMEWNTQELRAEKLGLAVSTLHDRNVMLAPRGPGEVFHIATTWEMTDEGHSSKTGWTFSWLVPMSGERDWQERRDRMAPTYVEPAVTFHVKIHRGGSLPLGRPHVDRWEGKDTLTFMDGVEGSSNPPPNPPGTPALDDACDQYNCYLGDGSVMFYAYPNDKFVPEGTKWIEATLTRERIPSPYYAWDLHYRPANQTTGDPYYGVGFTGAPVASGSTQEIMKFRIPITDARMVDSPYAGETGWYFRAVPHDPMANWQDYWTSQGGPLSGGESGQTLTLKVIVHRDPMPTT